MATISESGDIARNALKFALSEVLRHSDDGYASNKNWGIDFGKRWIAALHEGLQKAYPDENRFVVFSRARPASGPMTTWRRNEYLYDVTVAEAESLRAPIHATVLVPVITRCLWQVESEVRLSSSSVAEDLGKLVFGSADSKLLIVAAPAERNLGAWIHFIEGIAEHVPNNFFLALIPTYSVSRSKHRIWREKPSIRFYTRVKKQLIADHVPISVHLVGTEGT